jgi:hypothetical protein
MKLITSKQFFTEPEAIAFIENLPDSAARSAKILTRVEISAIGCTYISYFVLYEA